MSDQLAVVLAACAALGVGTGDFIGSRVTKLAHPLAAVRVQMNLAFVFSLMVAPFVGGDYVGSDIGLGVIAGVIAAGSIGAFYFGFSVASAGVVAAFTAVSAAVVPILIDLGLGNRPGGWVLFGAVLASVALAAVTWSNDFVGRVALGALLGVVTGSLLATTLAILSETSEDGGIWPVLTQRGVSAGCIVVAAVMTSTPPLPAGRARRLGFVAGTISALAIVTLMIAAQTGPLTAVAVAGAMFPAVTIVWSATLDGPRLSPRQTVGVIGVFVGVVIVVLG